MAGGYSHYLLDVLSIIAIDLLLAGDNALVLAMAVRGLPQTERRKALLSGAGAAVLLRVGLTFLAARLLQIEFIQLAGGLLVVWIAVKVLRDARKPQYTAPEAQKLWPAVAAIMMADLTMSTDNILAVAGAAHGNFWLILFGLGLSIPVVISSSTFLSVLMDKYPVAIYAGAAVLGRVAGEMIFGDLFVRGHLHPANSVRYGCEALLIAGILAAGRWLAAKSD